MPSVRLLLRRVMAAIVVVAALTLASATAGANDVLPGFDLFRTDPNTTQQDFSANPIPANFFNPGADPFNGIIRLDGNPLGTSPFCPQDDLSQVDTIVERLQAAVLPEPPPTSQDQIPIEIVELSLVSSSPITVTYNGGQNPELWDVDVELSGFVPQQIGTMTIRHDNPSGGTFDSDLPVTPRFTFTRQSDATVRILDVGGVIHLLATDVPWVHTAPSTNSCTSNFCVNPGFVTVETALLTSHGVISICPDEPTPTRPSTWGRIKVLYR